MEARVCARILPALPPPLCVPSWLLRPPRPILHRGLAAAPSSHRPCLLNFWTGAPTQCGMPLRARYKLPTGFLPAWDLSLEGSLHGLSSASRAPSSTPSPATCSRTCPFAIVVNLREALCRYRPQLDQVRQGSHLLPLTFGSNRQFASQLRRHLDSQGIMLPNLFSWMYTSISLSSDTHLSTITDAVMLLPHMLLAPWFQIRATVAAWLTLQAYGACRQGSSAAGRVVDCSSAAIPFAICSYQGFNRHHSFRRSQVSSQVGAQSWTSSRAMQSFIFCMDVEGPWNLVLHNRDFGL
ncbi:uncharacterized protein LOC100827906 isoform X2 [Brachypodium distachyon]|uniref:uncharacterized protein LOC100827906 isoform X2 n=1 Tax=Brachypodium distachyon TaxID=15368 RepID=UPI000D0D3691|nr:uncharacterized protein LOC100827906 isoform X2 [Brachypodium distachyon]|eukprot:XP_024317895.1 uncharacterized protein LOC100827906 isoform X2 [Brachypodium distachyon]